jgi:Fe2+ transport system protein FeoA
MISDRLTTIDRLPPRTAAVVVSCSGPASFRLRELGMLPGTHIRVLRRAPLRDPLQVEVGNSLLALRLQEARSVQVEPLASGPGFPDA